jgi:hypothetical protein
MTQSEWTPTRGWIKAAIQLPIRTAAGVGVVMGLAWLLNAMLDSVGADGISTIWPFGLGAIGGVLAGGAVSLKLDESTGLAGRTVFLPALALLLAGLVLAWYLLAGMLPWDPELLMWMMGPAIAGALVVTGYLLWLLG